MKYDKIPGVVELYEHINFEGQVIVMVANHPDLRAYGFNDKVSSVKVFKGPTPQAGMKVRLHRDINYQAGYIEVKPGDEIADLRNSSLNDTISSIEFI